MNALRVLSIALVACGAVAASCASTEDRAERPRPIAAAPSGDFDVAALRAREHFAFRESGGGGLVAGHATHVATVAKDGSVRVSPRWRTKRDAATLRRETRASRGPIPLGEPAINLVTSSLARGETLAFRAPSVRTDADGSAVIDRGPIVERLKNGAMGVEQSWEIAARPHGRGDLVLDVALSTSGRIETDRRGLRVVDPVSSHAMTYGHATWIDARGERTDVAVKVDGSRIVLRVPDEVVERSSYPAVLDPTISPELSVDDAIVDSPGQLYDVPVVSGGKNGSFLVAWLDERIHSPDDVWFWGWETIIGARVSAAGQVLDPTGIAIAPLREYDLRWLELASGNDGWLATWRQEAFFGGADEIVATRISEAGVVLDPANITVVSEAATSTVFDGTDYLVVWRGAPIPQTNPASWVLWGQSISAAGALGGPLPFVLADQFTSQPFGELGCDGAGHCLFVRNTPSGLRGRRLAKGSVASSDFVITSVAGDYPRKISFDGTNFVIGYDGDTGLRAVRVAPATGAVLDPSGIAVNPTTAFDDMSASIGGQTLFAWFDASGNVVGARMSSAGVVLDPSAFALTASTSVMGASLGAAGSQYLLGWSDDRLGNSRETIYAGRVSSAGQALDGAGVLVRQAAHAQRRPAVAGDGTGWLVAWEDLRARDWDSAIYAARLDANGQKLDPTGFELSAFGYTPSVASSGDGYLVVYSGNGCEARLVSKAGVPGPAFKVANGFPVPRVIFDGTNYVVISGWSGVRMVRVSSAGAVLDATPIQLSATSECGPGACADIASNGQELFATWGGWSSDLRFYRILGARLAKSGQIIDTTPIVISEGPYEVEAPVAAWDGKNYVVAWRDFRNDYWSTADVYGARVTADGKVLEPNGRPFGTGFGHQVYPAIIPMNDGATSLIAWSDMRRTDRFREFGIYGTFMRIDDGTILDPGGREISDADGNELFAAFAPKSPGSVLMVYHRDDFAPGMGSERVHGRFVSSGIAKGQACTADADCASRVCSDGVCCGTPCGGACQTCSATPGTCTTVEGADDPDTCGGSKTCGAGGECRTKSGRSCETPSDCLSGFCAGGICCDRACDGACETCAAPAGTCTTRPARSTGAPSCAPYACDGTSATCPTKCTTNAACPSGTPCDVGTGVCLAGAYCVDGKAVGGEDAETRSCAPFTCESGACRTTCRDVRDCIFPAICDESGQCVSPPAPAPSPPTSGCSAARSPSAPSSSSALAVVALLAALAATRKRASA